MSTEEIIIILVAAGTIIVFALSHMKVSRTWKVILFTLFPVIIVSSTILQVTHLKKKESKEAAHEKMLDQIDTYVKASLKFEDFIEAAKMNRELGRLDQAVYDVECALRAEPKSTRALNLLGCIYFDKGEYDASIETFESIKKGLLDSTIAVSSGEYRYHRNFGQAYMKKGMWKEAKEEFLESLTLNQDNLGCYVELAKCLDRLKEWPQLYDVCTKGTAKFPSSAYLHNFLGEACIATSRFDEGEKALLNAIEADTIFGQPYLFLAVIHHVRKQHERSAELVERALQLDPSLAEDVKTLKGKRLLQ